jgi:hypothetical protein
MPAALQERRRANIRGQHAFLDHPMRIVALDLDDTVDLPLVVEDEFGFDGFEIDRAAPRPRLNQCAKDRSQLFEIGWSPSMNAATRV